MKLLFLIVSTIAVLAIDCRDLQDGPEDRSSTKDSEHFRNEAKGYDQDEDHQHQQMQISSLNEEEGQNERIVHRGRCKPRNACVVMGGFCVTNTTLCSGRLVAEGCKPRGTNCTCCVPDTLETKLQNIEMELQLMKDNITDVILNQGTKLDSIKENQGCFWGIGIANQCFRIFRDHQRNWSDARLKCHSEGLTLAHPKGTVAVSLRKYLVETYGDGFVWLDAQADGSRYNWKGDGTPISNTDSLWLAENPRSHELTTNNCLALIVRKTYLQSQPNAPYDANTCSNNYWALCEVVNIQIE